MLCTDDWVASSAASNDYIIDDTIVTMSDGQRQRSRGTPTARTPSRLRSMYQQREHRCGAVLQ
jgi:hypothetical protein